MDSHNSRIVTVYRQEIENAIATELGDGVKEFLAKKSPHPNHPLAERREQYLWFSPLQGGIKGSTSDLCVLQGIFFLGNILISISLMTIIK